MANAFLFDPVGRPDQSIRRSIDPATPSPPMAFLNDDIYRQLYAVAASILATQELRAAMSPGDLLHDALLRFSQSNKQIHCFDLPHFKALAVRLIKRSLLDHVRRLNTRKRSNGWQVVPLESVVVESRECHWEMFEVREALHAFSRCNHRAGIVLGKRLFQNARIREIANDLAISVRSVKRDLRLARNRMYPERCKQGRA